jgi:hypothetical protein
LAEDHNYGTVGANTLRTASQIGNATGGADFAAGNSSAQTLRVVVASNQVAIPVTGTFWQTTQPVSGTVAVTQSTSPWVVSQSSTPWLTSDAADGPVTPGTVATKSILTGGQFNTTLPTLTNTQQASLQVDSSGRLIISPLTSTSTVTANQGGTWNIGTVTSITNPVAVTGTFWQATQPVSGTVAATQSGTWTVQQGSAPWSFVGTLTNNNAAPAANNVGALVALAEGTLSASRYTTGDQVLLVTDLAGNTNVDLQYYLGAAVSKTNPIATTISDGTNVLTAAISAYGTAPTGTEVMGVNAYITNTPTVNQGTSPWVTKDQSDGPVTPGTVSSFSMLIGGQYNSTLPTLTTAQQSAIQVDANGRIIIAPTTQGALAEDHNYGTVGANTLRTAAQIGNATGAANFGGGATGAQTLRVSANLSDGAGTALSSVLINSEQALEVRQAAPGLDLNGTGTMAALNATVAANTQGCSTVLFNVTGTFVLTYVWEGLNADLSTWTLIEAYNVTYGFIQGSNNAPNEAYSISCGGFQQVRMRAIAYTSGTATVTWNSSQGDNNDRNIKNDTNPISQTITTEDIASTATVGANGQISYTGTPTAGSVNTYSIESVESIAIEATGVWTGTIQVEVSLDSGGSWYARPLHQTGVPFTQAAFTGNFAGAINVAGYTNFRIRAIAPMTGTVTPVIVQSSNVNVVYVGNPLNIAASTKTTYMNGSGSFTPPATPTDMWVMQGSATKTIKILKIILQTTQTTLGTNTFFLKRYSTADTLGTSTTVTSYPLDTTNVAATATVKFYTANPTLGTLVGSLDSAYITTGAPGAPIQPYVWDFTCPIGQNLTLRGAADQIAVNFAGAALPAGLKVAVTVMYTEE